MSLKMALAEALYNNETEELDIFGIEDALSALSPDMHRRSIFKNAWKAVVIFHGLVS